MNADLALALQLADVADEISMRHYRSTTLAVRTKIDMTPVSEADEEIERKLRQILATERPGDGILGEEFGTTGSTSRRWTIDPIDGTKNYVRGNPVWGTLIALEADGAVSAGVISAPALARRWWASRGEGSFCNGERLRVSALRTIEESFFSYDSIHDFDLGGSADAFLALARRCARTRGFGDFWSHMLVAEGVIEIAVEPQVYVWDLAPIQIIVEEAGGRLTDIRGVARIDGGSVITTNGLVHDAVVEFFNEPTSSAPKTTR